MSQQRVLLAVLIAGSVLALVHQAKTAEPAADRATSFPLWEPPEQGTDAPPKSGLRIPKTHPYLALTPQEIERAKDRVAHWDWAKQAIQNCRSEADGYVSKNWDKLPDKGDTEHWNVARRLFAAGLAYAFSRRTAIRPVDPRRAAWPMPISIRGCR